MSASTAVPIGAGSTGSSAVPAAGSDDRAETLVVLAKQPLPGRVKTRLQAEFSADQAAELAAAALSDTLGTVRRTGSRRQVLAWDGDPAGWSDGFDLVGQGIGDLSDRLTLVFETVLGAAADEPTLLIAMDTPQVSIDLLRTSWDGADAVIGLSDDGGYWAIGLRRGPVAPVFENIPMSTERTGAAQLARLLDLGYRVKLLPPLRDVDTPEDAAWVADRHPYLRFARRLRAIAPGSVGDGLDRRGRAPGGTSAGAAVFDQAYRSRMLAASTGEGLDPLRVDDGLWWRPADDVDRLVLARCEPPVLDLGCGPGRMVAALIELGQSALGVDLSVAAVEASLLRGGPALRRDLSGRLPGEGRWETVLLMDSNLGIGGDVDALLSRCAELVTAGGLILCETDPEPHADEAHDVRLTTGTVTAMVRWSRIGADALARHAAAVNLLVTERWTAGGRAFVALRTI